MFEEYGILAKTELFGTYRVDLVISLFSRILDLHNFEIVMHALTPHEAACLYCRIGWYVRINFFLRFYVGFLSLILRI